jgi:hypothetical protein
VGEEVVGNGVCVVGCSVGEGVASQVLHALGHLEISSSLKLWPLHDVIAHSLHVQPTRGSL